MIPKKPKKTGRGGDCQAKTFGTKQTSRRAAVLIAGHGNCLSPGGLNDLPKAVRSGLRSAIDLWVGRPGMPQIKRHYHGWNKSQFGGRYTDCFVFKHTYNNQMYRLYGFLDHTNPKDRSMLVFVGVHVAIKKPKNETDETDLKHVLRARDDDDVKSALTGYGNKL